MVFDFRKRKNPLQTVKIGNDDVEIVESYKYLGVTLQNDLKWNSHISSQIKKANKRMFFVRCLRNIKVDNIIICMFYNTSM